MVHSDISLELQRALSRGAEIGLARAIASGGSEFSVTDFIAARLSALSAGDLSWIRGLADEILAAGEYITSLSPEENIDATRIPTVPVINESDWSGKRVRTPAEWSPDSGETWFKFTVDLPDITDFGDLIAYAHELAQSYIDAYPGRFESITGNPLGELRVRTVGAEKAF